MKARQIRRNFVVTPFLIKFQSIFDKISIIYFVLPATVAHQKQHKSWNFKYFVVVVIQFSFFSTRITWVIEYKVKKFIWRRNPRSVFDTYYLIELIYIYIYRIYQSFFEQNKKSRGFQIWILLWVTSDLFVRKRWTLRLKY